VSLDRIDLAALYREHMTRAGRCEKDPGDWDGRAKAMSQGVFAGAYVEGFVARLDLSGCATLLDVGCGPGTIALTVAPRLERVYGLDYSPGMLDAFVESARQRGISNATPIRRAWEDDWADVPECDVVVASRSTQVADLAAALEKLHRHARRRVYLTHLVGGRFVDDEILEALGRTDEPLPDYLYVVALLHQRGIHPRLDYLEGENRLRHCQDFADCLRKVTWSLGELTPGEIERLRSYYESHADRLGRAPRRWALVSWEKDVHRP
jgi:SAM-dependent methyltransferase